MKHLHVSFPHSAPYSLFFVFLLLILALPSCQQEINLGNFDSTEWKKDINGCQGVRLQQVDALLAVKDRLITLKEAELRKILGRPDRINLSSKNKKSYLYYLSISELCTPKASPTDILWVDLAAIGKVKLITRKKPDFHN